MSKEEVIDILQRYILDDLASCDTGFVRDKLYDICGCSDADLEEL